MFKQTFFSLFIFIAVFEIQGYAQPDAIREKLSQAPDSTKAVLLLGMAKAYEIGLPDSCMFYARKASEMAQKMRQDVTFIAAETLLSQKALENKDYYKATGYQKNILDASLRIRDWDLVAQAYYQLAQTWLLRYQYAEAIDLLKKGLEVVKERNHPELLRDYYQSLINAYQKLYNVNAVCEYYPLLMEVNRQMDATVFNERIASLQAGYDSKITTLEKQLAEKPEPVPLSPITGVIIIWAILVTLLLAASIIFYRYRIAAITTKDQKILDETIQAFDTIKSAQESSFQFLTQYAYSGIDNLHENINRFVNEQGADILPSIDNILNRINNEVFALYGFFQNFLLLLQSQSGQLKPKLATVNVPQLATNLLADYESFAMSYDIQLVNDVQNNVFAMADERLIDIVLRNMMSNAFKFAPKGGLITLGAKENYEDVEIWVTDDGIGLAPEQVAKLFELSENLSLPANPDLKGFGLGLAVCKALVSTCKGKIWAETKPDEGFCVRFSLPKADNKVVKAKS